MGQYGTFTFIPPHEMINWEEKPHITIGTFDDHFCCKCWRRIESEVRWGTRKFISVAQFLYIFYDVIVPFDAEEYRKGWRSMDDFHEKCITKWGSNGYAQSYRTKLTVNPPVELTDDECKLSIELGRSNKRTKDFVHENTRLSTWVFTYKCLKENPVEWITDTVTIKNCGRLEATDKAKSEIRKKGYAYCQFIDCHEES